MNKAYDDKTPLSLMYIHMTSLVCRIQRFLRSKTEKQNMVINEKRNECFAFLLDKKTDTLSI